MQKNITKMHKNLNFLCLQEYMGDKKRVESIELQCIKA